MHNYKIIYKKAFKELHSILAYLSISESSWLENDIIKTQTAAKFRMFDKIFLFHKPLEEILCQTHPEKMDGILQLRGLYPTKKAFPFPTFSRMVLLS